MTWSLSLLVTTMVGTCAFVLIMLCNIFYFYNIKNYIKHNEKMTKNMKNILPQHLVSEWGGRSLVCVRFVWETSPELIFMECLLYALWHVTWYFLRSSWMSWFACHLHHSKQLCWIQLMFLLGRWMELRGWCWIVQDMSLVLPSCVTSGNSQNFFEPLFLGSKMGTVPSVLPFKAVAQP